MTNTNPITKSLKMERQQGAAPSPKKVANLADSADARTAQFTLISILLGVILASLLTGLPRGANAFAINLVSYDPGVCLRALTVVIMAAVLWLEYTWGILTRFVYATTAHNLTYFALAITLSGVALAVADFRAWLAWVAGLAVAAVASGVINQPRKLHEPLAGHYRARLRRLDIVEITVYATAGSLAIVASLIDYLRVPPFLTPMAQVWCSGCILLVVVADLVMQVALYIPRLQEDPVASETPTSAE